MSYWDIKRKSQYERDLAGQRLDCFLTITYLYPYAVEPEDLELLNKRETELSNIYKYTGWGFFAGYCTLGALNMVRLRRMPYFRGVVKHGVLSLSGMMGSALLSERMASELWYNKIMIQLADKYNFTPEEV